MVIIAKIAMPVINPTRRCVDKSGGIELANSFGKFDLGIVVESLSPSLVIDYLQRDRLVIEQQDYSEHTQAKMLG